MIPTCLQIFMTRSSIRISSFTQTFSGSVCFPFLPALHFSAFTSYGNSFQTHLWHPHPSFFFYASFSILHFQLIFPMATVVLAYQKSQQVRASGKQHCLLPTCAILITSVACRSTDWYLLKYKQTHLSHCSEVVCESYCNPHTDKVISQDWLIRGVLLKQVDNPLSLCYTSFSRYPGFALIQVAGTIVLLASKVCFCVLWHVVAITGSRSASLCDTGVTQDGLLRGPQNKVLCASFPLAASHHLGAFRLGDQSN